MVILWPRFGLVLSHLGTELMLQMADFTLCCKLSEMDPALSFFYCSENEVEIFIPVVGAAVVVCFLSGLVGLAVAGGTLGLRFMNLSVLKLFPFSDEKYVNKTAGKFDKYL